MVVVNNKYRKKPVVIEAIQWKVNNIEEITLFMGPNNPPRYMGEFSDSDRIIGIETLEGLMIAKEADWVIKGVIGEFYTCKLDIFEATYEKVEG